MAKKISLTHQFSVLAKPRAPFNFDATARKPLHFPAPIEHYRRGAYWQTMRFGGKVLGLKMEDRGSVDNPLVKFTFYSKEPLSKEEQNSLVDETCWDSSLTATYQNSPRFLT